MKLPFLVAYLDPGTGSYVLQIALASIFGALYAAKHAWAQVKGKVLRGAAVNVEASRSATGSDRSRDVR